MHWITGVLSVQVSVVLMYTLHVVALAVSLVTAYPTMQATCIQDALHASLARRKAVLSSKLHDPLAVREAPFPRMGEARSQQSAIVMTLS